VSHYSAETLSFLRNGGSHYDYIYSSNPMLFRQGNLNLKTDAIPRIALMEENSSEICFLINRTHFKNIAL
jgi:hypothetical protein